MTDQSYDIALSSDPSSLMTKHPSRRKRVLIITISAIALLGATAAGSFVLAANTNAEREQQYQLALVDRKFELSGYARECGIFGKGFTKHDDGEAAEINRAGMLSTRSATLDKVACYLQELGASSALSSKLGQTRALDGTQTDTWDNYEASWNYHPDSGLNLIIERPDRPPKLENFDRPAE